MMEPLPNPVTKKRIDRSTMDAFSFGLFCDRCGKEWRSPQYAFNPGALAQPIDPALRQMLWSEQHRAAFERANREASFAFNLCPMCGRRACGECFYLSDEGVSDICLDCLQRMDAAERTRSRQRGRS